MESLLGHSDYFFENLMVTVAFYLAFPDGKSPENMWKSYVNLCNIYSFYRFCAVCGCGKEVSRERLFYVLVQVSRSVMEAVSPMQAPQGVVFSCRMADMDIWMTT